MKYKEISSFVVCMFLLNLFAATLNNYYILKTSFSGTFILNIQQVLLQSSQEFFRVSLRKKCLIRSYSGPHFSAFELNTERYRVSLYIQSECGKMRNKITPNKDNFHTVFPIPFSILNYSFNAWLIILLILKLLLDEIVSCRNCELYLIS